MNYIFVVAKYYIYANKFSQKDLYLEMFLRMLKSKFQSEKYIAYMNNNTTAFLLNGVLCIIILTPIKSIEKFTINYGYFDTSKNIILCQTVRQNLLVLWKSIVFERTV